MTRHTTDDGGTGSTTRRGFVKLGVGAGAAAAGMAAGSSPAAAAQCDPELSLSCSYGNEPDYGISYLVGRVKDHFGGSLSETEDYDGLAADSLYLQARTDGKTIKAANESVLTTMENLLANAKSVAYQKARTVFLERLNAGDTPTQALQKAKDAISSYVSANQKNLLDRATVVAAQVNQLITRALETPDISPNSIFYTYNSGQSFTDWTIRTTSHTLCDGSTYDFDYISAKNSNGINVSTIPTKDTDSYAGVRSDPDAGSKVVIIDSARWTSIWSDLDTVCTEAKSEIQAFYDGIVDQYNAGDISTEDLVSPSDLWSMSSEDAENPYAAADLSGLGLEVNQDSAVVVNLLTDGTKLEGSVYLSKSPIGGSLVAGKVYDPSLSRSTDSNGDYTDSLSDYAGSESDPLPLDGLVYIAYNNDSGSTYGKISQPFRVEAVYGKDGQELQSASYEPSTGQQTTTTDIDELKSELQSMTEEINRLEDERRELATNGGTTGPGGSIGTLAAAAAGGGLLWAFLGGGGSS